MKIQDIMYLILTTLLFLTGRSIFFVYFGLGFLMLAIPLFSYRIFFTAERLTWYASSYFLIYTLLFILDQSKKNIRR